MKHLVLTGIIVALAVGLISPAGSASIRQGIKPPQGSPALGKVVFQSVAADRPTYNPGEPITFVYTITNSGNSIMTFNFRTGKQYDIWVTYQGAELYRLSRGKMYTQALGKLVLLPGASKQFTTVWDARKSGLILQRGSYTVHAQLQPSSAPPPEVISTFAIGGHDDVVVPLTISEAIRRSTELAGKNVSINAVYLGWKGGSSDGNLRDGPPLTRSDWIITDATGGMYVSGATSLDPGRDVGTRVSVVGKLARTSKGQVYLVAQRVSILK